MKVERREEGKQEGRGASLFFFLVFGVTERVAGSLRVNLTTSFTPYGRDSSFFPFLPPPPPLPLHTHTHFLFPHSPLPIQK